MVCFVKSILLLTFLYLANADDLKLTITDSDLLSFTGNGIELTLQTTTELLGYIKTGEENGCLIDLKSQNIFKATAEEITSSNENGKISGTKVTEASEKEEIMNQLKNVNTEMSALNTTEKMENILNDTRTNCNLLQKNLKGFFSADDEIDLAEVPLIQFINTINGIGYFLNESDSSIKQLKNKGVFFEVYKVFEQDSAISSFIQFLEQIGQDIKLNVFSDQLNSKDNLHYILDTSVGTRTYGMDAYYYLLRKIHVDAKLDNEILILFADFNMFVRGSANAKQVENLQAVFDRLIAQQAKDYDDNNLDIFIERFNIIITELREMNKIYDCSYVQKT